MLIKTGVTILILSVMALLFVAVLQVGVALHHLQRVTIEETQ
jgi:hypothetical protein